MGLSAFGRKIENRSKYSPNAPKGVTSPPLCRLPPAKRRTFRVKTVRLIDALSLSRLREIRVAEANRAEAVKP